MGFMASWEEPPTAPLAQAHHNIIFLYEISLKIKGMVDL